MTAIRHLTPVVPDATNAASYQLCLAKGILEVLADRMGLGEHEQALALSALQAVENAKRLIDGPISASVAHDQPSANAA